MLSRRDFFRRLAFAGTGLAATQTGVMALAPAAKYPIPMGIQLWSLRDVLKDNIPNVLQQVAQMGFTSVEPYGFDGGFYGYTHTDFKELCAGFGLDILSTHTGITVENAEKYAQSAAQIGMKYLVLPSLMGRPGKTIDDFKNLASELNRMGEICQQSGIKLAYHNHDFEFKIIDNQTPYDILLQETQPNLVHFQMDIYWVVKGGKKPADYFENYPGRFALWHIKDLSNEGESCIVGNGKINYKKLLKDADTAGLQYAVYEQEQYSEGEPLQCARESAKYLNRHFFQ